MSASSRSHPIYIPILPMMELSYIIRKSTLFYRSVHSAILSDVCLHAEIRIHLV